MHWVLRVTGTSTSEAETDLSLLWYVASPDENFASFDAESNSVTGSHVSVDKTFWLSYIDSIQNQNADYSDGLGNTYLYNATYFNALTIDEGDNYNADKYFFNELKTAISTTPPHLANADSLYRAETAYSGNLVTV